jgi:hypothetical protein
MRRFSLGMIVVGAVVMAAACADVGPTGTTAVDVADVADVAVASAQAPSGSCTYTFDGTDYDVTVSWSGLGVTAIDLYPPGGGQPLVQTVLGHPTRKGSITYSNVAQPGFAQLTGRQDGLRLNCVASSSA